MVVSHFRMGVEASFEQQLADTLEKQKTNNREKWDLMVEQTMAEEKAKLEKRRYRRYKLLEYDESKTIYYRYEKLTKNARDRKYSFYKGGSLQTTLSNSIYSTYDDQVTQFSDLIFGTKSSSRNGRK